MNFKLFTFNLLFLTAILSLSAFSQTDSISVNTIVAKTEKYLTDRPNEKVYLHLDKPYYAVTDTLWLKAYVTIDIHQPSSLSKIVYVDIIAHDDSLVQTVMLPLQNGVAWAGVPLLAGRYQQGNYRIRAYTKWMMNSDPSYFFDKKIAIGDATGNKVFTNISFKNTGSNKAAKVDAQISFKNQQNIPLINRKVNWTVQNKNGIFLKGKGTTDADGNVTLSLAGSAENTLSTSSLTTILELADRKTVASNFSLKSAQGTADIQFFPEGGQLLEGIRSKVAFKAINLKGLGLGVKGSITDNDGKAIVTFNAQYLGMGAFYFTPEVSKTYKATVVFADGSQNSYMLPKAQANGATINVTDAPEDKLAISLLTTNSFFEANRNRSISIIAQSYGQLCYAARINLRVQNPIISIPKDKMKTGVIQITVFSTNGTPLCERLAFIWHAADQLNLAMASDKKIYTRKQKVTLNLTAKNQTLPVDGNFSVSVIDESKTPYDTRLEENILTSMLLQADIKGFIEKPGYYLERTDKVKLDNLDLVMLTQGYRQIVWKEMLAGKYPPLYFAPEQGIEIGGTLRNNTGMPVKGGNVRLQISNKNTMASATSNAVGEFKFKDLSFTDSAQITLNARNNVNANTLMIMADNTPAYPGLIAPNYVYDEVQNIDSTISTYLQNSKRLYDNTRLLQEVVITSTVKKTASHIDYPALSGLSPNADHLVSADRLTACANLLLCFKGSLPGVTFENENFYVSRDFNAGRKIPMSVFVRGMPVDVNYLASLSPADVESVEIFLKDELGTINRTYQTNGVIVVNAKAVEKGKKMSISELRELLPPPYIVKLNPKGFYVSKDFYSPKYTVPNMNAQVADLRTTIYWNPNVNTGKTGTATMEFYNADGRGTYRAIVEGMDKDGNIGRYVYRYKVE